MSTIYIGLSGRLKGYSAAVKGRKAILRIEVEFDGHDDIGYVLRELDELQKEQSRIDQPVAKRRLAPLLLEDRRGE